MNFKIAAVLIAALALGLSSGIALSRHARTSVATPTTNPADYTHILDREQSRVVLYSIENCGYCQNARALLAVRGVDFVEISVEKSETAREECKRLGAVGVPFLLTDKGTVEGYDEARWLALLATL
jgi:glutaredoxin